MSTPVAPSSFSTLLRRSKFASYDPAINQAYTSYGGFAYRGHWGTKRDLPPKRKHKVPDPLVSSSGGRGSARRNPVAFISALDSAEGQTEWKSAEKDVRWLRRLEELGSGTHLNDMSAWSKRVGSSGGRVIGDVDSEFGSADSAKNSSQQMTSALPNTQAMSERQFKSYIAKLRAQRADFHEFLQKNGVAQAEEGSKLQPVPMYALAQEPTTYHTRFLAHKNQEAAVQPTSNTLTPLPHPSGGLDYLNPTPLMSQLLYPNPVKGRYIQPPDNTSSRFGPGQKYDSHALVSIAGNSANLVQDEPSAAVRPVDWHKLVERDFSQPLEQPTSMYRVEKVELFQVPGVVGKSRQNIEGADVRIRARDWSKRQQDRPNPHRPGTFEYASHEDTRTTNNSPVSLRSGRRSPINALENTEQQQESSQALMSILDTLLAAAPNPDKKT